MSIILNESVDPRDRLSKARRMELVRFARERGVSEIVEAMPAELMRKILRDRGLTDIAVPDRPLGNVVQEPTTPSSHKDGPKPKANPAEVHEVDAVADLMRQWKEHSGTPIAEMNITELRKACKARGIKIARTDNMAALKAKLDGKQDAA